MAKKSSEKFKPPTLLNLSKKLTKPKKIKGFKKYMVKLCINFYDHKMELAKKLLSERKKCK